MFLSHRIAQVISQCLVHMGTQACSECWLKREEQARCLARAPRRGIKRDSTTRRSASLDLGSSVPSGMNLEMLCSHQYHLLRKEKGPERLSGTGRGSPGVVVLRWG